MAAFSNVSIKAPVRGKPHICLREGFYRVSPWHINRPIKEWAAAHDFARDMNDRRPLAYHEAKKIKKTAQA